MERQGEGDKYLFNRSGSRRKGDGEGGEWFVCSAHAFALATLNLTKRKGGGGGGCVSKGKGEDKEGREG